MASSYSTDLKIELMVTGENAGTWGTKTNDNLNVIQQAIAGFKSVSIAGGAQTTNLLINNSPDIATSDARNAVIKLTGTITGNQIVTVPTGIEKTYIVQNGTTGAFTVQFIQSGGTGTTFSATDKAIKILFADGTNINSVDLSTLSGTIATAQIADLAITSAKLASFAVTSARLASFAVTGVKITQSTITQSKLAANSVGANQLISTGVVAASYTAATITVDADGRITAASSGSAGAGMGIPVIAATGPASGTYTATPTANRIGVYMYAGGGGGGGSMARGGNAGNGGAGGFGFYNKPITQPFSQPFAVGAPGNPGGSFFGPPGGAGGNTSISNVGTVNGGNGGASTVNPGINPSASGNAGSSPGASLNFANLRGFGIGVGANIGVGGTGGGGFLSQAGNAGATGALVVFENTGT